MKRALAIAPFVVLVVVLTWGWLERDRRLRAEGLAESAHKETVEALLLADSVMQLRQAQERRHRSDSLRFEAERMDLNREVEQAGRERRVAMARADSAALAVTRAAAAALGAAGQDSVTVAGKIGALLAAHDREVGELRLALQSEQERSAALERTVSVLDSTVISERAMTAAERASRLAAEQLAERAITENEALRDAGPSLIERAARVGAVVGAFLAGLKLGQIL